MKHFNIEILTHCKVCGKKITIPRYRTFCSKQCRTKNTNRKNKPKILKWLQRKRAQYEEGKIPCLICGGWYHQLCSHVYQRHELTNREYKKLIGKDLKKGIISQELYDKKREQNINTKDIVWQNLKQGIPHRFRKGSSLIGNYPRSKETIARLKRIPFTPNNPNIRI